MSPWPLAAYDAFRDWPVVGYRIEALGVLDWGPQRLSGLALYYVVTTISALVCAVLFAIGLFMKPDPRWLAESAKQKSISGAAWIFFAVMIWFAWGVTFNGPTLAPDSDGRYSLWVMAVTNIAGIYLFVFGGPFLTWGFIYLARDSIRRRESGRIALAVLTIVVLTWWNWPRDPRPDFFETMALRVEQAVAARLPVEELVAELRAAKYRCIDFNQLSEGMRVYHCDHAVLKGNCRVIQFFELAFDDARRLVSSRRDDSLICL